MIEFKYHKKNDSLIIVDISIENKTKQIIYIPVFEDTPELQFCFNNTTFFSIFSGMSYILGYPRYINNVRLYELEAGEKKNYYISIPYQKKAISDYIFYIDFLKSNDIKKSKIGHDEDKMILIKNEDYLKSCKSFHFIYTPGTG